MASPSHLARLTLRGVAAVLLAIQGAIHLRLYQDGFSEIPTIGLMFLAGVISAGVLAIAVLVRPHRLVIAGAIALSASQLAALVVASTVGLFGFETTWTWTGTQGSAIWSEVLAVAVLVGLLAWNRVGLKVS